MKTNTRFHAGKCLLMWIGFTATFAQTPAKQDTPDEALTSYLASFDVTPMKSGLFLNQGFLMDTVLHQYRQIKAGTRTTAVNNADQWQGLYVRLTQSDITRGKLSQTTFEDLSRIAKKDAPKIGLYDKQELVSLGVIDVTGEYLTKAELEENRKNKTDKQKNTKTYGMLDIFSVVPFKEVVYNANVRFVLNEACYITNKDKTSQTYEIDFGDEQGFRKIKFGTAISVRYKGKGDKLITTRFRLNGKELFSAAKITVLTEQLPTPYMVFDVPASTPKGGRIGQGANNPTQQPGLMNSVGPRIPGLPMGAQIAIYLGGNCSQVFDKPVIIFEGFDPTNNVDINYLDSKYGYGSNLASLWNQGFDRVYVSFGDGGDYIENNAQVVQQVIQRVNSIKVGNTPNIVFGESMGGLCARMGLRQMENAGIAHQVSHYISYDSPHKGANFPPGFQAFVRTLNAVDFRQWFGIAQSTMDEAFQALDSPAAKQMLLRSTYEIGSTYALNGQSDSFSNFQQSYESLGLPQQTRNIALSDGAGNGSSQPGISNGQSYVSGFFMNFLVKTFFGISSTDVYASNTIAYLTLMIGFVPTTVRSTQFSGDAVNYDVMPGGYYDIGDYGGGVGNYYKQFWEVTRTIQNFLPLPIISSLDLSLRFGFVPTYSSVAYTGGLPTQMNPNLDLTSLSKNNGTPFDRLLFDNTNKAHANGRNDATLSLLISDLQSSYPGYYSCSSELPPTPNPQLSQALNFSYPSCLYGYFSASPVDRVHYNYEWNLTCNGQPIRNESGSPQFYFRADRQGCFTVTLTMRDIINSPYPSATVSRVVCPPGVCQSGQGRTAVAEPEPEPGEYLQISPNPGDKEITVLFVTPTQAPATMQLTTVSGIAVKQLNQWLPIKSGRYEHVLDGSALADGVYIVTVRAGAKRISTKLVIHH